MDMEYAKITLDRYNAFLKLEDRVGKAETELYNIKKFIKGVYTVEILGRGMTADPLDPRPRAAVKLNEKRLADLLGLKTDSPDIVTNFVIVRD